MLDIRVVTIFYTIPLRHPTSPRVSAADKDDEASTRRKRPRARPPRKRFLFGTRRNKKPKSPEPRIQRETSPCTAHPLCATASPRLVVAASSSRHRATRRTMKFGQLFAATTASMAPNVREQVRDANARATRNDATTTARTTTAKRGDGRWRGRIFPARDRRGGGGRARVARVARSKERQECARRMRARTPRMGTVRARWWASSARRRRTEGGETRERLEGVD